MHQVQVTTFCSNNVLRCSVRRNIERKEYLFSVDWFKGFRGTAAIVAIPYLVHAEVMTKGTICWTMQSAKSEDPVCLCHFSIIQ